MRFNPTLVLSSSALALTIGLSSPAYAQDTQEPADLPVCEAGQDPAVANCRPADIPEESVEEAAQEASGRDTIVVTGSRIRRPNVESNVPITSVSAEDLTSQGDVSVGDALNDLPSLRSTFNQANSTRFIGTTGLNVLDLRGLGTSRTLVLVNGRRHITASPGDYLVDVNTIPSDLIERVDVITGGSSAVYGSDAVAGVVNFVLKTDYEGLAIRGQAGSSSRGDRGIQFMSLVAGENFLDDRANVAVNLEYAHADALYFTDRPGLTGAFDGRCQFNANDFTGAVFAAPIGSTAEPPSGDGIPDQSFFCDVRNGTISTGGTFSPATVNAVTNPAAAGYNNSCVNPAILANPTLSARCLNPGTPFGQPRIYRFDPAGSIQQDVPIYDFRPYGSGNIISSNLQAPGTTLRETGQLAPGLDRYTANLLLNYEASPAAKVFFEGKYVHIKSLQEGQPSFFQGGLLGTFSCSNPFLDAGDLAAMQAVGRCTNVAAGTFALSRFNVDFGGRSEVVTRDTFRFVGGIRGDFNDDWNYEVSVNYGKVKIKQKEHNDLVLFDEEGNFDGYLLAYDAVRDPNTNQIVCRVNSTSLAQNPAGAADDRPDCVPINVFGFGAPSQAALDFVNTTSWVKSNATEFDVVAFMGGDSSQLFELPGGPIRFVLGLEYRRETASQKADPLSASGATFFNAFGTFDPPAMAVFEQFGELELPILKDMPFAKELTITGAGRYSNYNKGAGNANTTFAWNLNGTWAPVGDIRFRANYSKSVRVPTLGDLYSPPGQNFAFISDPCDANRINNNPNRPANCAALGVPVGFIATAANSASTGFISSGNELLQEETGKSFTLGAVITPRWVPGLSMTVDYYKIRVDNLIATLTAQQIVNTCVDLPTINNQYCALIAPRVNGALATPQALFSSPVNFAKFEAKGIDFELAYRKNFANGMRLNFRGIATRVLERSNYTDPVNPDIEDRILQELGDPKWAATASTTWGIGNFDVRYTVNYVGKATIGAYENYFEVDGAPGSPFNEDSTEEVWYGDAFYHAVRVNAKIKDHFNFYVGVDNLFDKKPPFGLLGTGGGDPYDTIGRYFYAGAQVEF